MSQLPNAEAGLGCPAERALAVQAPLVGTPPAKQRRAAFLKSPVSGYHTPGEYMMQFRTTPAL